MAASATTLRETPPFLVGAGLLLWGWQCGYLPYAVLMAAALEYPRFSRWRIPITDKEFNHVADLSTLILLAVVMYLFTVHTYYGIYSILALLPFLFFLLLLAQRYSTRGKIKLSALFISLRRLSPSAGREANPETDLSFPYLLVCIISATAGNHHAQVFYLLVVLLFAWSLWWLRPRHGSIAAWTLLFALAATSGYGAQIGVQKLQGMIEEMVLDWFNMFTWRHRDPARTTTAIGSLGKLKLSDRIMVRVDTHGEQVTGRILLRETTYTDYGYGIWTNFQNTLQLIDPSLDGNSWIINRDQPGDKRYTISFKMDADRSIIPVPLGITTIANIKATEIDASAFNSIMLALHPGWARYDVLYTENAIHDVEPLKADYSVPHPYREDMARLVRELDLADRPPEEAVAAIENFFADNFSYSLTQTGRYPRGRYLSKFLFETRQGHCEYFATATVLLLRAAGIPARYAVGYSLDEYNRLEGQYLGRGNHAHSWAQAYVNGSWRVVDTTPPIWSSMDSKGKSVLGLIVDLWSWLTYTIATWGAGDTEDGAHIVPWLAVPLLLYLAWRMWIKKRLHPSGRPWQRTNAYKNSDSHSGLHDLLSTLERIYFPRHRSEPLGAWFARIEELSGAQDLRPLLALHYRRRFDPRGLKDEEESRLAEMVRLKISELTE